MEHHERIVEVSEVASSALWRAGFIRVSGSTLLPCYIPGMGTFSKSSLSAPQSGHVSGSSPSTL
jgi:hypothetical protein